MNKIKEQLDLIHNDYAKRDITLIHIADLHFSSITKPNTLQRIKESIIKKNPDYLVITGDLIDTPSITKNKYKIKELLKFLTDLSNYTKIIISLGSTLTISSNITVRSALRDGRDRSVALVKSNKSCLGSFLTSSRGISLKPGSERATNIKFINSSSGTLSGFNSL